MKTWRDILPTKREVWAEKMPLKEILGREITITGFDEKESRFTGKDGERQSYIAINFELDGSKHFANTGSMLIRKQLIACKDELPFRATIVKKDTWLTLS